MCYKDWSLSILMPAIFFWNTNILTNIVVLKTWFLFHIFFKLGNCKIDYIWTSKPLGSFHFNIWLEWIKVCNECRILPHSVSSRRQHDVLFRARGAFIFYAKRKWYLYMHPCQWHIMCNDWQQAFVCVCVCDSVCATVHDYRSELIVLLI